VKFDALHQVNVKQSLTAAAISHAAGVFHICGANISHQRYFTRSKGTNFTEKSICNRKCFFHGASGDTAFFKKHSNINGFRTPEQRNYLYSALLKQSISAAIARFIFR